MPKGFRWEKLGLVYQPPLDGGWRHSYGQSPTTVRLQDRRRIFFSVRAPRDMSGQFRAEISWVDVKLDDPAQIVGVGQGPILQFGAPGTFDEHGLMPGCALWAGDTLRMYYCGWMRLGGVPYASSIGLAESHDGGSTFAKISAGPLFSRTPDEPYQELTPFVLHDGERWHMLYGSGIAWVPDGDRFEPLYVIKHATSFNGFDWARNGQAILPLVVDNECQCRPTIVRIGSRWHLWFSYRYGIGFRNPERGYRIGYAWSDDLALWHREDSLGGIELSTSGWDSESVCYSYVFTEGNEVYMYYNGNGFGEGGFGVARLVTPAPERALA